MEKLDWQKFIKKLIIIVIIFFGITTNAQKNFNTDNIKLTIYNNLEYTKLSIGMNHLILMIRYI